MAVISDDLMSTLLLEAQLATWHMQGAAHQSLLLPEHQQQQQQQ
jgi:hypothetical protein